MILCSCSSVDADVDADVELFGVLLEFVGFPWLFVLFDVFAELQINVAQVCIQV